MGTTSGAMAQLVAHHTGSVGVRGSSPLSSTFLNRQFVSFAARSDSSHICLTTVLTTVESLIRASYLRWTPHRSMAPSGPPHCAATRCSARREIVGSALGTICDTVESRGPNGCPREPSLDSSRESSHAGVIQGLTWRVFGSLHIFDQSSIPLPVLRSTVLLMFFSWALPMLRSKSCLSVWRASFHSSSS
jgi:hypothetical protein